MSRTLAATLLLALAGLHGGASATAVTVSGASFVPDAGYGIDANEASGTLLGVTFPTGFTAQTFTLTTLSPTWTFSLGNVVFSEPSGHSGIKPSETDNLGVTALLMFTSPFGSTVELTATGLAWTGATNDAAIDLTIDWAPVQVAFGVGGLLGVELADLSFTGNPNLPQSLAQNVTITLLNAPVITPVTAPAPAAAVPEPGSLALAACALVGAGLARRRTHRA